MILHLVAGAPGSGKTKTLDAFLALKTGYMGFDIDWLIHSASDLARKDIFTDASTWPAYGKLWFDVLHTAVRNGQPPIFFTPNTPEDLALLGQPEWCSGMRWLLLDCPDAVRRNRLNARPEWGEARILEAIRDAAELRELVPQKLDTSAGSPAEIAQQLLEWLTV